jgi:hypothetical protein
MEEKTYNEVPDIMISYDDTYNPSLKSPNSTFEQPFYQTRDSFTDIDYYKRFLENCISRFRHSKTYKNYKHYLYSLGLDHCQLLGQVSTESGATIEMHHNFLNIFDITLLITEHLLNTVGYVSTFDVVQKLKEEHRENNIPIVMLSKTAHQLFHNADGVILPARMCFGYWIELLRKYNKGITIDIAQKVVVFIQRSIEYEQHYIGDSNINTLLAIGEDVTKWSQYNEYGDTMKINGVIY